MDKVYFGLIRGVVLLDQRFELIYKREREFRKARLEV